MLYYPLVLFRIAPVAAILGCGGTAAAFAVIAQLRFAIFCVSLGAVHFRTFQVALHLGSA